MSQAKPKVRPLSILVELGDFPPFAFFCFRFLFMSIPSHFWFLFIE